MSDEVKKPGRPPKEDNEAQALRERIRLLELQVIALAGKVEPRGEAVAKADAILEELRKQRMSGGKNHWRVYNSRYKTPGGDPVTHDFWSNATKPEQARQDYNERNGRSWDITVSSQDPLKFELVTSE